MPAPEITPGAPCWIDLMTSDIVKARQFYGELFGWECQAGDEEKYGGYTTARKNGKMVAGLMQKDAEQAGMPDMWSTYLRSDDAAATAAAVTANGGQVYMPPMDVPEQGYMAIFGDAGIFRIKGDDESGGEARIDDRLKYVTVGVKLRISR